MENKTDSQDFIKDLEDLEELKDKKYFSITEVSSFCDLKPHVLRYWEQEFKQIKPLKKQGNRRFYQKKDIIIILHIKHLLYDLSFTINGARKYLNNSKKELSYDSHVPNYKDNENIIEKLQKILCLLQ